jgi:hypothetical protein
MRATTSLDHETFRRKSQTTCTMATPSNGHCTGLLLLLVLSSVTSFATIHRCGLTVNPACESSSARFSGPTSADPHTLTLHPIKTLDGTVTLPGSKSLSNRCLLLAALAEGDTHVENLLDSDDIRFMLQALETLQVPVEQYSSESVLVKGQAGPINSPLPGGESC